MNTVIALLILIAGPLIAPIYYLITKRKAVEQRLIRIGLWTIMALQLLLSMPLAVQLPDFLRSDVGRFDDSMHGLLVISILSGMASAVTILLGNTLAWLYHKSDPRNKSDSKE